MNLKVLASVVLGSAVGVFVVDQATKTIARSALAVCPDGIAVGCDRDPIIGPLAILRTENAASAFGLSSPTAVYPLVVATILLLAAVSVMSGPSRFAALALGLQVGGLAANLADRILFGGVTDFIQVQVGAIDDGLILNLADVALLVGSVMSGKLLLQRSRPLPPPSAPAR